jgi:hypothetical protein
LTKNTKIPRGVHFVVGRTAGGKVFEGANIKGDRITVMNSGVFDRAIQRAGRSLQKPVSTKRSNDGGAGR